MKEKKWLIILLDCLLAGVLLVTFAFFHHVLPKMKTRAKIARQAELQAKELPKEEAPSQPEPVAPEGAPLQTEEEENREEEPIPEAEGQEEIHEEEPETRTPWQIQFADKFTDEIVQTANSYSSPDISITITTVDNAEEVKENPALNHNVYYIADIYVSSIECFRSWLAHDTFEVYCTQNILEMSEDSHALLAMTGDFYSYQFQGISVRNGAVYRSDDTNSDICVLYKDGTMTTYSPGDYNKDELLNSGDVWQLWKFGPRLLDEEGHALSNHNTTETVTYINPRSAVGYYEPGHYCFIVVDGRQDGWSTGMRLGELGRIFEDLGCSCAYNLDGGGSAVMVFGNEIYSHQSNGADRELGDILLIAEPSEAVEITAEGGVKP